MSGSDSLDGLRVLAHPLRLRILSLLTGTALSAAEAARELGETQANISYHFRRLHEAGLLTITEELQIRGGRAKRYRHLPEHTASGLPEQTHAFLVAVAEELRRRTASRAPGTRTEVTDAELWISPDAWSAARAQATELGRALHAAAQPPRTPGTHHISATLALFELQ